METENLPRLAPKPLSLEPEERKQLRALLNRHRTPQQIALRAKIVMLAAEGRNHHVIARAWTSATKWHVGGASAG